MTEIAFHVNVVDKLGYACRLLRASQKKSARVLVCAPQDVLNQLSAQLWALSPTDFFPHCMADATPSVLGNSSIVLAADLTDLNLPHQVLLHLGAALPSGFERFERLIEVVSQDQADVLPARKRWKHYKDRGYALTRYDAVSKESTPH